MPNINLLDISNYQDVDFNLLVTDPHNFKAIWIKTAEGHGLENYPHEAAIKQIKQASIAGLSVQPYHFYYYHLPWNTNADGVKEYKVLDPIGQAKTFYESCRVDGLAFAHPLTDIEDPYVGTFLAWKDTATANTAIAFARKLNGHLKKYHEEVYRLFGSRPDIYTGAWWWDRMSSLMLANGYGVELSWTTDYNFYLADYSHPTPAIPAGIRENQVIAHQYTSTPPKAIIGVLNGLIGPGLNVDLARWMKSDEEFELWANTKIIAPPIGNTMANTYKQSVSQGKRATFVVLSAEENHVDMASVSSGTDLVFLKMGGQDVKEGPVYIDGAFKSRALQASIPIMGFVTLDTNFPLWVKQFNLAPFEDRKWYENETLKMVLQQWRLNPITETEWASHNLNIKANDGGWISISGLTFFMDNTTTNAGSEIGGVWQKANLTDAIKFLRIFMLGGYIPVVPIFLMASNLFLKKYDSDPIWQNGLMNLSAAGNLNGVGIFEVGKAGLFTESPMAVPFASVKEIFAYRPSDIFTYSFIPYGMESIQFHVYSFNRFRAIPIQTNGSPSPVMTGVWCDTPTEMRKTLSFSGTVVIPPTPDPEPDPIPVPVPGSISNTLREILLVLNKLQETPYRNVAIQDTEKLIAYINFYKVG